MYGLRVWAVSSDRWLWGGVMVVWWHGGDKASGSVGLIRGERCVWCVRMHSSGPILERW